MSGTSWRAWAGTGLLVVVAGCGGGADQGGAETAAEAVEPRIALNPTAADALPPVLMGTAGAPAGMAVDYYAADPSTHGYLAVPEGAGPFPAVILIHQWNGLVDRVRQMADAMAAEGYIALAADLYSGRTGSSPEENTALVNEVDANPEAMIANLNSAVEFLRSRRDVTGRIGAMGWCFGGGIALSFGLDGVNHDATAIFYGRLLDDPAKLRTLKHEVYGTFAALDTGIPPEAVERFVTALREAGVPNDVHVYDDVNHGFWLNADEDPARQAPALDAWQRLKAYLGRTLR
jgi:carboxymethylenebutenolidase